MKPFLKWAGGKYRLKELIVAHLPKRKRLIEPFVGSGAIFLNSTYDDYLLGDGNPDLIQLYQHLQQEKEVFITYAQQFFLPQNNTPKRYYYLRSLFNTTADLYLKSALFIYLNRHGYNGLCRYNSRGNFNVPFGRYSKIYFPELEMRFFYKKAANAIFECASFSDTMRTSTLEDVIYCDPPYHPLSKTAHFTRYHQTFNEHHQIELATLAQQLCVQGIPVVISNHDTEFTRQLYSAASINSFAVQRYISCRSKTRHPAHELLAIFTQPLAL